MRKLLLLAAALWLSSVASVVHAADCAGTGSYSSRPDAVLEVDPAWPLAGRVLHAIVVQCNNTVRDVETGAVLTLINAGADPGTVQGDGATYPEDAANGKSFRLVSPSDAAFLYPTIPTTAGTWLLMYSQINDGWQDDGTIRAGMFWRGTGAADLMEMERLNEDVYFKLGVNGALVASTVAGVPTDWDVPVVMGVGYDGSAVTAHFKGTLAAGTAATGALNATTDTLNFGHTGSNSNTKTMPAQHWYFIIGNGTPPTPTEIAALNADPWEWAQAASAAPPAGPTLVGRSWSLTLCSDGTLRTEGCSVAPTNPVQYEGFMSGTYGHGPGAETCVVSDFTTYRDCLTVRNGPAGDPVPRTVTFTTSTILQPATSPVAIKEGKLTVLGTSAPGGFVFVAKAEPYGNGVTRNDGLYFQDEAGTTCGSNTVITGLFIEGVWNQASSNHFNGSGGIGSDGMNAAINTCVDPDNPAATIPRGKNIAVIGNTIRKIQDNALDFWGAWDYITVAKNEVFDSYHPGGATYADETLSRSFVYWCNNVYAYNNQRNILMRGDTNNVEVCNNVVHAHGPSSHGIGYDPGSTGNTYACRGASNNICPESVNLRGNHFTSSPASIDLQASLILAANMSAAQIYSSGNRFPAEETNDGTAVSAFSNGIAYTTTIPEEVVSQAGVRGLVGGQVNTDPLLQRRDAAADRVLALRAEILAQLETDAGGSVDPVLSSPSASSNGATQATFRVTTDTAGGQLPTVVVPEAAPCDQAPTKAQISAGENNAGNPALFSASPAVLSVGLQSVPVSGLTATTAYCAYAYQDLGGTSSVVSAAFVTSAAPSLTGPAFFPEAAPDPCDAATVARTCGDGVLHCPTNEATAKTAFLTATAGDFICFADESDGGPAGGIYTLTTPTSTPVLVSGNHGTAAQRISVGEFPNSEVTFRGIANVPEWQDGIITGANGRDSDGFSIDHDYWSIHGLRFENIGTLGVICGNHTEFHDIRGHMFARFGFIIGNCENNVTDDTLFSHIFIDYVLHGSAFNIRPSTTNSQAFNTVIKDTYIGPMGAYTTGVDVRNSVSGAGDPDGGGNSDGLGTFTHSCPGTPNNCIGVEFYRVFMWNMGDDCIDISSPGVKIYETIGVNCTPDGAQGIKIKEKISGVDLEMVGNFIHSGGINMTHAYEIRVEDGESLAALVNNTAVYANSVFSPAGQSWPTDTAKSSNSAAVGFFGYGVSIQPGKKNNNLGYFNVGQDFDSALASNDWSQDAGDPDPQFVGPTEMFFTIDESPADNNSLTPRQRLLAFFNQVTDKYKPAPGSPLIDAGVFVPGIHCARADDAAVPYPADDQTCRHWRGAAPDIGSFEFGIW